jgi:hypothetical protein
MSHGKQGCTEIDGLDIISEFVRGLRDGVFTHVEAKLFLEKKNPFPIVDVAFVDVDDQIRRWQVFLDTTFGISLNPKSLVISPHQRGLDCLIIIPEGPTLEHVILACQKRFKVRSYCEDLHKLILTNTSEPRRTYAFWIRDRIEADKENSNISATIIKQQSIPTMMLLERLLYGLKYYTETDDHLDRSCTTLCAASRDMMGQVPTVAWNQRRSRLEIHRCEPDVKKENLRARTVVL